MNNHHKPTHISAEFKLELEQELAHLRQVVRPALGERLKSAREGGDITDNSAFEEAKEELARVMTKISDIEATLRDAIIIHHNGNGNGHRQIDLGSIVTIAKADGTERTFTLVSSLEASPTQGKISDESPIGRAIYGRKKGEVVEVTAPAGLQSYTITDVR